MAENAKNKYVLFIVCLFGGWFGLDKLYHSMNYKMCLIKLALNLCIVGLAWNIYDMVTALMNKYELVPSCIAPKK